ncbi:MAG: L-threonylcarbamoyladenylate synthase [Candidatus Spechtbacterales bacterium]
MIRIKLTEENLESVAKKAAEHIRQGEVVIFPTDTLYGLGVDALKTTSVEKLFALKKRPASKPVPVFVKNIEMAKEFAFIDKKKEAVLERLWPGPFTVVLDKKEDISDRLSAGTGKVGLRMPADNFCLELLRRFEGPITGSSANVSGMSSYSDIDAILRQFKEYSEEPAFVVDAGVLEEKEPSTVVDLTGAHPRILRMNQTTLKKLKEVFDNLDTRS